jgi:nitrate reductase NapAB chaperone NapD
VTSGLVVTLEPDSPETVAALAAIRAAPGLTVGERDTCRLPVALETDGHEASERCCDWLRALPGVAGVEVVFVHWDEVEDGAP